ncbi:MAG: PAS domain-containing protein [Ktedonobacteraceae bacterium]|nr:PAS domain-containing protein [Ktedonobacteraceae bacterium]
MLKLLERSIALQLLVFYCLFIIPLVLGGAELYLFQHDALQQNTRRNELGFAQAISLEMASHTRAAIAENAALTASQAARQLNLPELTTLFTTSRLSHPDIDLYFVCDTTNHLLLSYPSVPSQARQQKSMCDYIPPAQTLYNSEPSLSPGRVSPTTRTDVISIISRITDERGNTIGIVGLNLSLAQFTSHLETIQRQLSPDREARIWIADERGRLLASTEHSLSQTDLRKNLPGLTNALHGEQGSLIAHEHDRDWLYSYLPVTGTHWAIVVQRPTDVTFATIISFQNSLLIALVTLIIGASFFWFTLHGWVVAPLVKLTRAVSMVRPDQTSKVTDSELLARDRTRIDEIGRLIAAISTMEDEIHDLFSKTDAKSQARLHMLDAIMRSMSEGMLLERPDGHIMYANQSFTQLVGIAPQEFLLEDSFNESQVEEKLLEIIEDPAAYREAIRNAENSSSPHTIEFQVRGFYNHIGQFVPARRDIRVRLFQVRDRAGQLIGRGKIFRDVTRNNEAEQIKKNLLAIVSHELRTPLTAIKGYATSLLETDVELDEELQQHFLQAIVGESDRMADLVTSLLDMSQLDAGALKLSLSLQHLEPLIKQVVPADMRGHMRVQIPENLPLLLIDRRRMEVVLRNLVENTRRHAGAGATIEFTARYEQDRPEAGLYLSIADNGPGFPPDLTERIFDRFYQVDGSRQRRSGGVGLGLAICRGFVEAHGGRIWAENRTDGETGAVFHIWLPSTVLYVPGTQHIYFHELVD